MMPYAAYGKAQNQMEFSDSQSKQNFDFILKTKMIGLAQCVGEKGQNMLMTGSTYAYRA
jgi:hypothetical protein